jgi:dimethylargininase
MPRQRWGAHIGLIRLSLSEDWSGGFGLFTRAIVRRPGDNFADGLTTVDFGVLEYGLVLAQWEAYCRALESCGLVLTYLEEDLRYPDSTFVEDAAVITEHAAMLTRPGAGSRLGEVEAIAPVVREFYPQAAQIVSPGTLDGGDICETGKHFFLGVSLRTNGDGARQLAVHLAKEGFTSSLVDVRHMTSILHLKSGISYIGPGPAGEETLVVMEEMAAWPQFAGLDLLVVSPEESYAANCVRVNDRVLVAAGYPRMTEELRRRGYDPLVLEMSEFQKMDGGLSCLSLRF